jgi:hypothetical protein
MGDVKLVVVLDEGSELLAGPVIDDELLLPFEVSIAPINEVLVTKMPEGETVVLGDRTELSEEMRELEFIVIGTAIEGPEPAGLTLEV